MGKENTHTPLKKTKSYHLQQQDGHQGHYTKWYKSVIKRQISFNLTYIWNPKKKKKTSSQIHRTGWSLPDTGDGGVGKMGEGVKKYEWSVVSHGDLIALLVKNPAANAEDLRDVGSIPESGRLPGGGYGNPLQYSCLENPMDLGAWHTTVHEVAKSWTWLKLLSIAHNDCS